jgi:RNA polymerase sigma-70 factor (ECF subfamily)
MDLDDLVRRFRGPLAGFCAARGLDAEAADRVAHDAFVAAWLGREQFRGKPDDPRAVGAWLRGIARNLLFAAKRERPDSGGEVSALAELPAGALADSERDAVRAAVQRLPPHEREVVWMFYFDDAATREVAGVLGISEKAVENRLRRARQTLRRTLADRLDASEAHSTKEPQG